MALTLTLPLPNPALLTVAAHVEIPAPRPVTTPDLLVATVLPLRASTVQGLARAVADATAAAAALRPAAADLRMAPIGGGGAAAGTAGAVAQAAAAIAELDHVLADSTLREDTRARVANVRASLAQGIEQLHHLRGFGGDDQSRAARLFEEARKALAAITS